MRVGFVVHTGRDSARRAAVRAAARLSDVGVQVVATPETVADLAMDERVEPFVPDGDPGAWDLAVSFGGDGTFLRAAHVTRDVGVPVLGVNLGRVGFLAEVEVGGLDDALDAIADGRFVVEERPTLVASVHDEDGEIRARDWALNDVAVEKTARQRLLLMEVEVAGTRFASVPADALVLATATGSTAYALSAGGPILSPRVAATLVTPVAPHSLFDRTIVCGPDEPVRVLIAPDQDPAVVSFDGREPYAVPAGGWVTATGDGRAVRLARVASVDFYGLVRRKFSLT